MNRMVVTSAALAALALAAPATAARAQDTKGWELSAGMFAWQSISCSGCTSYSTVGTGGPYVAAAFYLNSRLAIEPLLSVMYVTGGGSHTTDWTLGVGVPIYFASTWGHKGWYVEPAASYESFSASGSSSEHQTSLGVFLGYKVPIVKDASIRIAGFYDYGFKSDPIPQTNTYGLQLGLSAFIH